MTARNKTWLSDKKQPCAQTTDLKLDSGHTWYLAHANCTLFFTSRAAFVCKKKTRSFRVFPPEN